MYVRAGAVRDGNAVFTQAARFITLLAASHEHAYSAGKRFSAGACCPLKNISVRQLSRGNCARKILPGFFVSEQNKIIVFH